MISFSLRFSLVLAGVLFGSLLLAACGSSGSESSSGSSDMAQQDSNATSSGPAARELGSIDAWYNGEPTSLSEQQGNPVLLIFWADY